VTTAHLAMLGEFIDERELTTRARKAATGCKKEIPRVSGGRGPLGSRSHNPPLVCARGGSDGPRDEKGVAGQK
jgi:hypothetical protein